jgi:hypothetical protein
VSSFGFILALRLIPSWPFPLTIFIFSAISGEKSRVFVDLVLAAFVWAVFIGSTGILL